MRRLAALVVAAGLFVGFPVLAQTDTPTSTPTDTPTVTPTVTPTSTNTPTNTPTFTPTVAKIPDRSAPTDFMAIQYGSFRLDPASITGDQSAWTNVIIPGLQKGDIVVLYPPATLETALVYSGARIVTNNTLGVRLSAMGTTDGAALDWQYIWWNRTQQNQKALDAPTVTPTP
jgi:hypothetical protein